MQRHGDQIDPYDSADVILATANDIPSPDDAISFLESKEVSGTKASQGTSFRFAVLHNSRRIGRSRLTESMTRVVRSAFSAAQTRLDKARGDYDSFLYLSTAGVRTDVDLAYGLGVAPLLAHNVYSHRIRCCCRSKAATARGSAVWWRCSTGGIRIRLVNLIKILHRSSVVVLAEIFSDRLIRGCSRLMKSWRFVALRRVR
jgi:hypothetical protein